MTDIDPAQLDKKIVIERTTQTEDEVGDPTDSWDPLATVWAKKDDPSSREVFEYFESEQVQSRKSVRFTVYSSTEVEDVTPADRVVFEGKPYEILTTRLVNGERFLELLTSRSLTA